MSENDTGRTRQTKGLVKEAIGKIIGDATLEKRGTRESEAGARQAEAEGPADKSGKEPAEKSIDENGKKQAAGR